MANQGAQDKTEKPTAKRRSKARDQGQIAKSVEAELTGVAEMLAGLASRCTSWAASSTARPACFCATSWATWASCI